MAYSLNKTINDLISACRDSEEALAKAAKGAHNDELRDHFMSLSDERGQFAEELQKQVESGRVADLPHGSSPLRAGYVDLETRLRPKQDAEILADCIRGEESTVKHFRRALDLGLPESAHKVVDRQLQRILSGIQELRSLELQHQPA